MSDTCELAPTPSTLAADERRAANQLANGAFRWILLACAATFVIALFLPFAAEVSGWQFLAVSDASRAVEGKLTEYLFVWFGFIGLAVITTIAMLTRRYRLAVPGWMLTGIAMVFALLAIWLRRSSTTWEQGLHHGPGIYLAMFPVVVAVFAYLPAIFRRAEEQTAIAEQRAALQGTDEIAVAQRAATERAQEHNPLLIDDRRQRAAERHKCAE
ncbi:hypothetical protein JZY91_06485 [Corynebacterium sp. CNCTC7651]|uniref:Rv2732c family membrane protein n=1 Tax=Corynebacterium sp. CNCTC7651 TaxID=2815361 RepID=UPI001F32CE2B|nr:hypothetical protein [Corynebacterium sp. CNCTC7651]UIZ91413.1 hypothetical protein JZY91_06485 [Corynebacterium sp. CNCTC7651]